MRVFLLGLGLAMAGLVGFVAGYHAIYRSVGAFAPSALAKAGPSAHTPGTRQKSQSEAVKLDAGNKIGNDHSPAVIVAMGVVKPEEVVEVGAQVNGMIEAFGPDPADPSKPIDHGSIVRKGTVLAQIDPTIYMAQVNQAEAATLRAKADVMQLQARCDQAKQEWIRAQSLLPEKAIADSDYDLVATNYRVTTANLAVGQATVQQSEASLRVAKTYLDYTVIKSPIDGVVLDRRVNVGQTVVAAFNVPGLFIIAKDLRRVQVWASVDEADVGKVHPDQSVQFTVDAYPNEVFRGRVTQIRLNPSTVNGRTIYTVVVATENAHGMLPYLTAKLRFEVPRNGACSVAADPLAEWRSTAKRAAAPKPPEQWAKAPGVLPNPAGDKNKNPARPGDSTPSKKQTPGKIAGSGVAAG